jgi:hypothetical protein
LVHAGQYEVARFSDQWESARWVARVNGLVARPSGSHRRLDRPLSGRPDRTALDPSLSPRHSRGGGGKQMIFRNSDDVSLARAYIVFCREV